MTCTRDTPNIQRIFKQFEGHSFKYYQALREIQYELFNGGFAATDELEQYFADLCCQIDDLHASFDKYRAYLAYSVGSTADTALSTVASMTDDCYRRIIEDSQLRDKVFSAQDERVQETAMAVAYNLEAKINRLRNSTFQLPELNYTRSGSASSVSRNFGSAKAGEIAANSIRESQPAFLASDATDFDKSFRNSYLASQVQCEAAFGASARDLHSKAAVTSAVVFPPAVADRGACYHIVTCSPALCFGDITLRQSEIFYLFRPAFLELTEVTQFELNCAYAVSCYFMRSRSQFLLDCAGTCPNVVVRNAACHWPRCALPAYCLLICQFSIRNAYANSIEYVTNVAVPYSFERPLADIPARGTFSRLSAASERRVNEVVNALIAATNTYVHAQVM